MPQPWTCKGAIPFNQNAGRISTFVHSRSIAPESRNFPVKRIHPEAIFLVNLAGCTKVEMRPLLNPHCYGGPDKDFPHWPFPAPARQNSPRCFTDAEQFITSEQCRSR